MLQARKAFTLLELIVVIVVAGILAGIAIPSFNAVKTKANEQRAIQEANAFAKEVNSLLAFTDGVDSDYVDLAEDADDDTTGSWAANVFTSSNDIDVTVTVTSSAATVGGLVG